MSAREWMPLRHGLRYVVQRLEWADAFGSAYKFARVNGTIARFWTRASAQRFADELNKEQE